MPATIFARGASAQVGIPTTSAVGLAKIRVLSLKLSYLPYDFYPTILISLMMVDNLLVLTLVACSFFVSQGKACINATVDAVGSRQRGIHQLLSGGNLIHLIIRLFSFSR